MTAIIDFFRTLLFVHPPHPVLVHFPIGLTGGAAFFMLLALVRRCSKLETIAWANLFLASASVVVAAAVGIRDNAYFYNGNATNHITKIILASVLFVLTLVTSLYRWKHPDVFERKSLRLIYAAVYFVSFAIALALGFLGGIIVYG